MNINQQEQSIDFKKYIALAISYAWLIILLPTVFGIAAYFYSEQQPKIYEARATLLVEQRTSGLSTSVSDYNLSSRLSKTYATLLTAEPFLAIVKDNGGFSRLGRIVTRTQENPPLIEIYVRDSNSKLTGEVANAVALNFIDYVIERRLTEIAKLQAAASAQGLNDVQSLVNAQFTALDSLYLLEPVSTPTSPIAPDIQQNVTFAIIIGLAFAFGLTFLISNLRDTVRNPDDIRSKFGVSVLGMVFEWSSKEVNETDLIVDKSPKSSFAEAFKQIRTNLQFSSSKSEAKVFLTSSPGPGDGKSTLISNLAVAIAQTGKKVIIFDGDLRRPTVHRRFKNISRDIGLSNYLSDNTTKLDSVTQNTDVKGVNVVTSGPIPPNPSELLDSNRMKEAIKIAKENYDIILVDCPPVLMVADTPIISTFVDMAILVVDSFSTKTSSFAATIETLQNSGVEIAGVIMNKLKKPKFGYGYGYGYGYYYNYYYYNYKYSVDDTNPESKPSKNPLRIFRSIFNGK